VAINDPKYQDLTHNDQGSEIGTIVRDGATFMMVMMMHHLPI
jgi:hypothetical protein